jgi:hypothetical protein
MSIQQSSNLISAELPWARFPGNFLRVAAVTAILAAPTFGAKADPPFPGHRPFFGDDNLVVTESVYAGTASLIIPGVRLLRHAKRLPGR